VITHTLSLLPDNHPDRTRLEALLPSLPKRAGLRQAQSVQRLLALMVRAFERPAPEQLAAISATMRQGARQLYSIDTLKHPAREESIELAREILRRLRNMRGSNETPASAIGIGNAEEKTALAQKLEDILEIYKNLLSEAAEINPGILNDPRIRDANEAAGCFAHAISLMAAREMPNSLAAAQQISADIAQMPEEWKNLDSRTVSRLTKTMEAGVERAAQDIEAGQQETQRQGDLAQEAVDHARQQEQMFHHRKRRRRSGSSGGLTKAAKRRGAGDLNGDGIADALQGLNLRQGDMIAVRQLGESLRAVSSQAAGGAKSAGKDKKGKPAQDAKSTTQATLTAFLAMDKILPDDKGFADRKTDERQNPRNGQRPRT
ncbi:MAG: hypothetical protein KGJ21_02105, partial [Pseudomonadota bacterium]|nr:hypothetical protein [Pseudomonadota bacterium]